MLSKSHDWIINLFQQQCLENVSCYYGIWTLPSKGLETPLEFLYHSQITRDIVMCKRAISRVMLRNRIRSSEHMVLVVFRVLPLWDTPILCLCWLGGRFSWVPKLLAVPLVWSPNRGCRNCSPTPYTHTLYVPLVYNARGCVTMVYTSPHTMHIQVLMLEYTQPCQHIVLLHSVTPRWWSQRL